MTEDATPATHPDLSARLRQIADNVDLPAGHPLFQNMAAQLTADDLEALKDHLRDSTIGGAASKTAIAYFTSLAVRDHEWPDRLEEWCWQSHLSDDLLIPIINAVTWSARERGSSALLSMTVEHLHDSRIEPERLKIRSYIFLTSARYNFDFSLIHRGLSYLPDPFRSSTEYLIALSTFSRMGQGRRYDLHTVERLQEETGSTKVLQLLLHALWFTNGQDEAHLMITIADRLLTQDRTDSVTLMRKATALRRLGKYGWATKVIDQAISTLNATETTIHQDYVRERELISVQAETERKIKDLSETMMRDMSSTIEDRVEYFRSEMAKQGEASARQTSDALFKVVEILGLFTALIAVIAATLGSAFTGDMSWWQRLAIVAAGTLFPIAFFALLRKIVEPRTIRTGSVSGIDNGADNGVDNGADNG